MIHYSSTAEISTLVNEFERCALTNEQWTHSAHVAVATWYLLWYGPDEATSRFREALLRLNAAHGVEQTPTRGFHETLTVFYMWAVRTALRSLPLDRSIAELVNAVCSALDDRKIPLRFYTKERLMSWEARTRWIEPDLSPLGDSLTPSEPEPASL